jgi:hypothetical protein
MDGVGTAIGGVDFLRGGSLSIQDCLIRRFSNGDGIRFEPGVSSRLSVQNTIISESGNGIFILPNGAAVVVVLDSITADGNAAFGVFGSGSSASIALTVINSTITNNALGGGIDLEASPHSSASLHLLRIGPV